MVSSSGKLATAAASHDIAARLAGLTGWDVGARGGVVEGWRGALPLLEVVAFDADADADAGSDDDVTWCPIGLAETSGTYDLHLLRRRSGSSLLPPNQALLGAFNTQDYCGYDGVAPINCLSPQDAISERGLAAPQLMKLDTQGTEISILSGFTEAQLAQIVAVELEVEFVELYEDQPLFCDVNSFMVDRGFTLFDLRTHRAYRSDGVQPDAYLRRLGRTKGSRHQNAQLVAGDAIYFRIPDAGAAVDPIEVCRLVFSLCMYTFFEAALWASETFTDDDDLSGSLAAMVNSAAGRPTIRERFGGRRVVGALINRLRLPVFDHKVFYGRRSWPDQ